jgi:hypothetical protein
MQREEQSVMATGLERIAVKRRRLALPYREFQATCRESRRRVTASGEPAGVW